MKLIITRVYNSAAYIGVVNPEIKPVIVDFRIEGICSKEDVEEAIHQLQLLKNDSKVDGFLSAKSVE